MGEGFEYEKRIVAQDIPDIIGQDKVKKQLKSAILMKRHTIIVGQPGIGKTTLVKGIAEILPERDVEDDKGNKKKEKPPFVRVQGSPDLTAEDLIGDIDPVKALKYGPLSDEAFTPGKIFKADGGILFFDEVNRCSEKLQNTLLQALEEKKVTIGSYDLDFNADFIFIGTMNPEESSTEPLSDVFLDRFDLVYMEPPETEEIELKIVKNKGRKLVDFPDKLMSKTIQFLRKLRKNENLEKHPSVRASIGIYERAQSNAYLDSRKKVNEEDLRDAIISVLSHRISLKPSMRYTESNSQFLDKEFSKYYQEEKEQTGDGP